MIRGLLSAILCGLCCAGPAVAAPARNASGGVLPAPDGERLLFIVDTSSSTENLQSAIETAVYDLIRSGVGGYMRLGDTYGLWTFNKETYAGKFPMQVWEPRKSSQMGTIAAAFLDSQTFEKSSNLKQAVATLCGVVRAVSNLNVFIISDGDSPMRGTPFDKTINDDYKKLNRERNQAKQPFVTMLVVRDGWFVRASVTISGQPIPLPARSTPPPVQTTSRVLTNQVIRITKASPAGGTAPPPSPPPAAPEKPAARTGNVEVADANTQLRTGNEATSSNASTGLAARPNPATLATEPLPTPRPRVVQIITKTNAPSAMALPATAEQASTGAAPSPAAVATNTSGTHAVLAESSGPARSSSNALATANASPSAAAPTAESAETPGVLAALLPPPLTVAARELDSEPDAATTAPTAVLKVVAVPAQPEVSAVVLLTFGTVLMLTAAFLILVVVRRARPATPGSLITQSMERR